MPSPPQIGPTLSSQLATYVPTWLGNVPGLRNLFSILWTLALQADALVETLWEGQLATYPGVGTPTAYPYIGASRQLTQGPSEPDTTFATRLIYFRQPQPGGPNLTVSQMGGARGMVLNIQAYLIGQGSLGPGNYPVVVFMDRSGNQTIANADRSITENHFAWNWDEVGGWVNEVGYVFPAVVDTWWSDGWVLIGDPYTHYTGFTDPNWLAAWNSGDQTIDSLCPQAVVNGVSNIATIWKGAHIFIRAIIWCPNPTALNPTGTWGNWSVLQTMGDQATTVAVRIQGNSYWQFRNGL